MVARTRTCSSSSSSMYMFVKRYLNSSTLYHVKNDIRVPSYPRTSTNRRKILHVGVGNFFRSHLARNVDRFNEVSHAKEEEMWTIRGVGIRDVEDEKSAFEKLREQNGLYGLLSLPSGETRVVGSLTELSHLPSGGPAEVQRVMGDAIDSRTKIMSLTVTEKGYCQEEQSGDLDVSLEDVRHDIMLIKRAMNQNDFETLRRDPCRTALGVIASSLSLRNRFGDDSPPITVLSCDNLPHNGNVLRRLVTQICEEIKYDPLVQYVQEDSRVSFPNSMVDRITPATNSNTIKTYSQYVQDKNELLQCQWPVIAEDFTQWVLEDSFVAGRPDWGEQFEDIHFVEDVAPYEDMKLRLLNGSHTAMAYMSRLAGLSKVDEAMKDSDIARFVSCYMDDTTCSVPLVPGIDLEEYKQSLKSRFSNEAISDLLERLCQDGSKKFVGFVLPVLKYKFDLDVQDKMSDTSRIEDVVASWICYLAERNSDQVDDPMSESLCRDARLAVSSEASAGVHTFVQNTLGNSITQQGPNSERFLRGVTSSIATLRGNGGVRELLKHRVSTN